MEAVTLFFIKFTAPGNNGLKTVEQGNREIKKLMKIWLKYTLHLVDQVTNLFNTKCIASDQSLVWLIAKTA